MAQVILGVNKLTNSFALSNYSLTTQIVIINFSTAIIALIFLVIFNFFLITDNKNIDKQNKIIKEKLNQITRHLNENAIKRILTFDDNCTGILTQDEENNKCNRIDNKEDLQVRIENKPPQLDLTYTQEYVYSNFLNTSFNVMVYEDNLIKIADTNDVYDRSDEVIISEIDSAIEENDDKNQGFFSTYRLIYFDTFNSLKKFFDKKKLNNQKSIKKQNSDITIIETIKNKNQYSYIYKDEDENFKIIFFNPIIKNKKVFGVVIIDSQLVFNDNENASQSILLTNFFIFFISIMFLFSFLFLKSIVSPIKILSHNTKLEKNKSKNNNEIINYPKRLDEIGDLSKGIKNMSKDLKKRLNEMEEFTSDVSHELKNPLAGLKSSSDLLQSNSIGEKDKALLLKNMGSDIDRMNILISDISNYSLTGIEISEAKIENVEIINFFREFKKSYTQNNHNLEIKNDEKEIYLKINTNKFQQVLHNILDNASTYNNKGSKILIDLKKDKDIVRIQIVDQGPGIPLDYKEKIFERFYTDRNKDKKYHSGLGLSISRKILESFNGTLNLIKSNHFGFNGACFEIKLPLKDQ